MQRSVNPLRGHRATLNSFFSSFLLPFPRGFFTVRRCFFFFFYGLVYRLALVSFSFFFFFFLLPDFYCMAARAMDGGGGAVAGSLCIRTEAAVTGRERGRGIDIGGAMKRRVFCPHGQLRSLAIKRSTLVNVRLGDPSPRQRAARAFWKTADWQTREERKRKESANRRCACV